MVIFAVKIQKKKQARAECTSGRTHSLYVDPSGSVWSCGNNENGELGLGHNTSILVPQKINNLPPIISVSAGGGFTLFVDANGSAWSCGYNQNGRLGLGDENNRNIPEQITNLPKIVSAIALGYSSIFLDCEGSVWTCGDNAQGQLGLGHTTHINAPQKIEELPEIKAIAGGYNHSLFLDYEGSVWACGNNSRGSLGLGDTTNKNRAKKIQGLPAIKSMAGGWHWSMFVDEQGNVWVCGANEKGELGMGHTTQINSPHKNKNLSGIVAVGGGQRCSVFLDNAGNIYTCGNNKYGQLGLGDTDNRYTPQKVNNIPPMSSISCSNIADRYLQIVDEDGIVWSCGKNEYGQLGLGHTNTMSTFQKSETLAKLQQLQGNDEKEMFKSIEKEQNKQLMNKVKACKHLRNVNKEQAKQKIIEGVIGMSDWSSKWKDIHTKNQQLHEPIEQLKVNLNNKQQKLDKLKQEVREIKQALSDMEEVKEVVEFFDIFLEPIAEAEKELKSGFEEKFPVIKHGDWTHWGVDEVSLFLNVCGMEDTVIHQRQMQIDGEVLGDAMEDVTVMEIKDRVQKRKMEFYLKVLHSGKMMNDQKLSQNIVLRHREVEKTLALLKEWEIALDENVVRKKGLSICELLYFKAKDFKEELGVEMKEAREMVRRVQCIKKDFEEFLERPNE